MLEAADREAAGQGQVSAYAFDHAQQVNLGQGTQNITFSTSE
jgi:hypothetical protein